MGERWRNPDGVGRSPAILIPSPGTNNETSMLPRAVALRKVVMSDKWQQINLRLDGELAQALREMKQGHDESLSEVVIRLLKRSVRQSSAGARGASAGRPSSKARAGRGAVGAGRKRKPTAPMGRAASGVAAGKKPWVAPAAGARAEGSKRDPDWVPPPARGSRRIAGKPTRPQPLAGSSEPRRRNFRAGADGLSSSDELGAAVDALPIRSKAKARPSNRR